MASFRGYGNLFRRDARRGSPASRVESPDGLPPLGNRIGTLHSVPTAIACFALLPGSCEDAIGHAILLAGDTDTLAAMAGAVSGACVGTAGLPSRLVGLPESCTKGGAHIAQLARRLCAVNPMGRSLRGED